LPVGRRHVHRRARWQRPRGRIFASQGQKTKFESCVTDVLKITETGLKIMEAEELSIGDKITEKYAC